ncbi:MAG: hypothetical protein QOF76_4503, partial [Solirubrobacteraceae bacterium]|nr:hypothetical protein [Solirubrobacteraceae bacterium]
LAGPLELRQWLTMPVMPEGRVLALLVLDRAGPSIGDRERDRAELFTLMLGHALESTVLRTRLAEVSAELRHLTASANALLQEAQHAPITLSTDHGWGAVFPSTEAAAGDELRRLLTDREQQIAALMVQGLSNPAIARELHLSPATVKAHVGRLLRKLGVSNRTEAAARVLALSG